MVFDHNDWTIGTKPVERTMTVTMRIRKEKNHAPQRKERTREAKREAVNKRLTVRERISYRTAL